MRIAGNVLVIDDASDTAEVLRAVFEPRGVRVNRLRSRFFASAADVADDAPAVVVIDSDSWQPNDIADVRWARSPRVIIGRGRGDLPVAFGNVQPTEFLGKPFQFAELVGTIEELMRVD